MRPSSGYRDVLSTSPTDMQFSKVVEPSPRNSAKQPAAWAASALDYAHTARQAVLAMSIVVLVGLAVLAASQTTR